MAERTFAALCEAAWKRGASLCIGLDPILERIPEAVSNESDAARLEAFSMVIVEATRDIAAAFKINSAFFEAHGASGWRAIESVAAGIRERAPSAVVILDAKRADIGHTNEAYARMAFDAIGADAITVHPYVGREALRPFLERADKGVIVLCKTSNPGSGELQDAIVGDEPLYLRLARSVAAEWNGNGNCGLVVGATYPEEIRRVRAAAPTLPFLIPGVGAQGGTATEAMMAGERVGGGGVLVSVSRDVLYASSGADFAAVACAKAQEIDMLLRTALVQ